LFAGAGEAIHILCGVAVHSDMHACLSKPIIWSRSSTCAILSSKVLAIVYAGVPVTLGPLPSANAEGPLQLLSTGQCSALHIQASHHQAEAQAVIGQPNSGHSPAKQAAAPGKTSLVSTLKHSKQLECYILYFQQPFRIPQAQADVPLQADKCL